MNGNDPNVPQPGVPQPQGEPQPAKASKRDALRSRLAKKYPDKNFDNDEDFYGQIDNDYEESEKQLGEYQDREKQLGDFMDKDPRSGAFLQAWKGGKNPILVLTELYGDEFMDYLDDPEKQEEIAEANKKYLERVASERKLEDDYQTNLKKSIEDIQSAQDQNGWDDDYVNNAVKKLGEIVDDAILGKISPDTLKLLANGESHDADMQSAAQEGEVRGRNAKIEEKLRKQKSRDGAPHLGGGGNAPMQKEQPAKAQSIFDIANMA